jgi:hypothetical protein
MTRPKLDSIKLMYIAGPYSGKTAEETKLNIHCAQQAGKLVARKGWMPVIPHKNTEDFEYLCPEISEDFWYSGTMSMLLACDAIFMCFGWENSKGSIAEHNKAIEFEIPIYYETQTIPDIKREIYGE